MTRKMKVDIRDMKASSNPAEGAPLNIRDMRAPSNPAEGATLNIRGMRGQSQTISRLPKRSRSSWTVPDRNLAQTREHRPLTTIPILNTRRQALPCLLLLLAVPVFAAVDGTVINKTTDKPQPNATVSLFKLTEAGPESLETVKSDAAGKFVMQATAAGGPHYVQVAFDGVTYTKMMPPGSPSTGIQVDVYNVQAKPTDAKITQHMLLLEPIEGKLTVTENIIYQNSGKTTFNDPAGSLRFYAPPESGGKIRVMATAPGGMPVERIANQTMTPNVYGVDFAIKPGESRFQFAYELPLGDPPVFKGKLLHKEGTTRLVAPRGVTLKGDGLSDLGREPATQAAIYNLGKQEFSVEITGSGSLREPSGGGGGEDEGPSIQEILPRLYNRLYLVLGLVGAILLVGFIMIYRNSGAPTQTVVAAATPREKGKRRG